MIEFSGEGGKSLALVQIVEGPQLSWPEVWDASPFLLNTEELHAWLAQHGVPIEELRILRQRACEL